MDSMIYFFGLFITIIICRFVFSIDSIVINLKAQTKLLVKLAEQANVQPNEILKIVGKGNKKMLSKSIEQKSSSVESK